MLKANNLTNVLDRRNEHIGKDDEKTITNNVGAGDPISIKAFDYQQESLGGTRSIVVDHKINKEQNQETPIRINDLFEQHLTTPGSGVESDAGKNIKRMNQLVEYLQIQSNKQLKHQSRFINNLQILINNNLVQNISDHQLNVL